MHGVIEGYTFSIVVKDAYLRITIKSYSVKSQANGIRALLPGNRFFNVQNYVVFIRFIDLLTATLL